MAASTPPLGGDPHAGQARSDLAAYQDFLAQLGAALRALGDPDEVLRVAAGLLGRHLHVARAFYAEIEDGTWAVIRHDYADGVPSIAGRLPIRGSGALPGLGVAEPLVVADVATDRRLDAEAREALRTRGVGAFITLPFLTEGRSVAALAVHDARPRSWTPHEAALARETADRTWSALGRARAEAALRESERRFSIMHDRAPFAAALTRRADRRIVRVNEAFVQLFGYAREELTGRTSVEVGLSPPEAQTQVADALDAEGTVRNLEVRRRTKDGAELTVMLSVDAIGSGEDGHLLSTVVDITDKKRTETALRESEARYRHLVEHSATGVVVTDLSGAILDANPAFAGLVGRAPADLRGVALASLIHSEDRDPHGARVAAFTGAEDAACDWEHRLLGRDGKPVWVRIVCLKERGPSGRVERIARFVIDISERKRTERELRASQQQRHDLAETLHLLLETAAQGILSIDEQGRIVSANRAVETMFGWPEGTLAGRPVDALVPQPARASHAARRESYWRAPEPRAMGRGRDLLGQRADGTTFPVEVSLNYVMTNGSGRAVAFITDITERKSAESELASAHRALQARAGELERQTVQLRRMAAELTVAEQRAREALARTMHDHLQQLLFSTKIQLDRLERRLGEPTADPARDFATVRGELDEAIDAARSLAVEIFPPVLHRHGLPGALAWLASWMEEKYRLVVRLTADAAADVSDRDVRVLVFESVRELLFDVVKHAGVTAAAVDLDMTPDDEIRITVRDEGVGFDPDAAFRSDGHGTGLGLVRIRERVSALGGRFEVDSAPGRGSRFRLIVPRGGNSTSGEATGPPLRATSAVRGRDRARGTAVRVLLVDDHAVLRQGLRELLRETPGLEVVGEAGDGLEAIERARALRPDAIVMDVSMPGMDGVEATRRILAELPDVRIFGFSTHERTRRLHAIEEAGAAGYFTKGVDAAELVRRLLDARRPGEASDG
ncbi:MAG: PAS domain S-box protein [Vicinamibacterales bacterium]